MLIFGVKGRYSLLGVSERRVFLEVSQTVYSLRLMIWGLELSSFYSDF